jgi:hypothetical protein
LSEALEVRGNPQAAAEHYRKAMRLKPPGVRIAR